MCELKQIFDDFDAAINSVSGDLFEKESSSHVKARKTCGELLKDLAKSGKNIVECLYGIARLIRCYTNQTIHKTVRLSDGDKEELEKCSVIPIARLAKDQYCLPNHFKCVCDYDPETYTSVKSLLDKCLSVKVNSAYGSSGMFSSNDKLGTCINFVRFVCLFEYQKTKQTVDFGSVLSKVEWSSGAMELLNALTAVWSSGIGSCLKWSAISFKQNVDSMGASSPPVKLVLAYGQDASKSVQEFKFNDLLRLFLQCLELDSKDFGSVLAYVAVNKDVAFKRGHLARGLAQLFRKGTLKDLRSEIESLDTEIKAITKAESSIWLIKDAVESVTARILSDVKVDDLVEAMANSTSRDSPIELACLVAFKACLSGQTKLRFSFDTGKWWVPNFVLKWSRETIADGPPDVIVLNTLSFIVKSFWKRGLSKEAETVASVLRLYESSIPNDLKRSKVNKGIFQLLLQLDVGRMELTQQLSIRLEDVQFQNVQPREVASEARSILSLVVSSNEQYRRLGCQTVLFRVWDKYCQFAADCCQNTYRERLINEGSLEQICELVSISNPLDKTLCNRMACALIGTFFNKLKLQFAKNSYWDVPHVKCFVAALKKLLGVLNSESQQYFDAYLKTTKEVEKLVSTVREKSVTPRDVQQYKCYEELVTEVVAAAGYDEKTISKQMHSFNFEDIFNVLRDGLDLLRWMSEQTGKDGNDRKMHAIETVVAAKSVPANTVYKDLLDLSYWFERQVAYLDEHCIDVGDGKFTLREFVTYFLRESKFFKGYVSIARNETRQTFFRIPALLTDVHRHFIDLLEAKVSTGRLNELFTEIRKRHSTFDVQSELTILRSFPQYSVFAQTNLLATIDRALDIVQHVTNLPDVIHVVNSYDAVVDNDDLYELLSNLARQQKDISDRPLSEMVESQFEQVRATIGTVPAQYWVVMKDALPFSSLRDFYTEHEDDFDDRKTFVSDRLRSDSPDQTLLNNAISAHRYVSPLMKKQPMKSLLEEIKTCYLSYESAREILETVHNSMDKIKLLFDQATTESARQMMKDITHVDIHLNRMAGRKTTFNLIAVKEATVDVQVRKMEGTATKSDADQPTKYSEEQVQDLRRILVFDSKERKKDLHVNDSKERKDLDVNNFLTKLQVTDSFVQKAKNLEVAGHPFYQNKKLTSKFDQKDLRDNEIKCLEDLRCWKKSVSDLRRSNKLFYLLSETQIMSMLILFTREISCKTMLLQKLSSETMKVEVVSDAKLAELIARFVRATGFSTVFDDYADRIATAMVPLKEENYQEPLKNMKNCLTELVQVPDVVGEECCRNQFYYCMPRKSSNSPDVINLLLSIFLSQISPFEFPSHRQVSWLSQDTTLDDVTDCIDRIKEFPEKTFVFVGVDKLSPLVRKPLQDIAKESLPGSCNSSVCYVCFDLMDVPGCSEGTLSQMLGESLLRYLKSLWKNLTADMAGPQVVVVCGLPLSGKTNFIYRHLQLSESCTHICINDVLDEEQIIQQLNCSDESNDILMTLSPAAPLDDVNKMLFSLLLCRSLSSDEGGICYSWPQNCNNRLVIEVSSQMSVAFDKPWESVIETLNTQLSVAMVTSSNVYVMVDEASVSKGVEDLNESKLDGFDLQVQGLPFVPNANGEVDMAICRDFVEMDRADKEEELTSFDDKNVVDWIVKWDAANVRNAKHPAATKSRYVRQYSMKLKWIPESIRKNPSIRLDLFEHIFRESDYLCKPRLDCSQLMEYVSFVVPFFERDEVCLIGDVRPGRVFTKITKEGNRLLEKEILHYDRETAVIARMLGLSAEAVNDLLKSWNFVLTADVAYKMVLLHHRLKAGIPVIIEGETGVGKTYLLEMYTELLNARQAPHLSVKVSQWIKDDVITFIDKETEFSIDDVKRKEIKDKLHQQKYNKRNLVSEFEGWLKRHCNDYRDTLKTKIKEFVQEKIREWCRSIYYLTKRSVEVVQDLNESSDVLEQTCRLLRKFLAIPVYRTFEKLLLHPEVLPRDIREFLKPVVATAKKLGQYGITIVVFFDELDTCKCVGTLKEIICDHRLDGTALPKNVFFVAATNPFTGIVEDENTESIVYETGTDIFSSLANSRVYHGFRLLESMEDLVWVYHGMRKDAMKRYLEAKTRVTLQALVFSPDVSIDKTGISKELQSCDRLVYMAHTFCETRLGVGSVSQRDVKRVFELVPFFWKYLPEFWFHKVT